MNAYFDTSVLVKNYCLEVNSADAIGLILAEPAPLPLTLFQEMELRNAIRLKHFRRELSAVDTKGALGDIEADIRAGRFVRPEYSLPAIFRRAEVLSAAHAAHAGARVLDILHVAAALEIQARGFVSFDERQRVVAKKAGLRVRP